MVRWSKNIAGVMINEIALNAIYREFAPRSEQTKDYEISIYCFSTKHAA